MKHYWQLVRPAAAMLFLLILLTGFVYPVVVTGITQLFFSSQANGSLVEREGVVLGSELIGQPFRDARYFWGRPSATGPIPYNAAASSGSNLGPNNPVLAQAVQDRMRALRSADPENNLPIPVDLVTASGSGLDPHISVSAAIYQAGRVARQRGITEEEVLELVRVYTIEPQFGLLGDPHVNVLMLNLALDGIK